MTQFSTKGYEAKESSGSKFMSPGIVEAKIKEIVYGESSQKQTPFMKIILENDEEQTCETIWYLSSQAWEPEKGNGTKWRVTLMADKLGLRDRLDKVTESIASEQDFVNGLNSIFKGVKARWVLVGEEIAPSDPSKNVWIKAELHPWKFVETLDTNPSTLKFDPKKDIKRLPAMPNDVSGTPLEVDDPFADIPTADDEIGF